MYSLALVKQSLERTVDPSLYNISRNNLEYCYSQMFSVDRVKIISNSIEEALEQALESSDCPLCLVVLQGTIHYGLSDAVDKYISNDYKGEVLVGHILDRGASYYEIHPQAFLIDVTWWDSVGRPSFSNGRVDIKATAPIRSLENHHDDYTPLWVKKGTEVRDYTNTRYGWNIIQLALESEKGVGVWPRDVRKSKGFTYSDSEEGALNNLGSITRPFLDTFYVHNTEFFTKYPEEPEQYDCIIAPASGLSGIALAKVKNLKPGGEIIVFDVSFVALYMSEQIYDNWNGRDYTKFARSLIDMSPDFIDTYLSCKNTPSWDNTHDQPDFTKWFDKNFKTFEIGFKYIDLYDLGRVQNLVANVVGKHKHIYFHTTNAYEYLPTAQLFSSGVRAMYTKKVAELLDSNGIHHNLGGMSRLLSYVKEEFNASN